MRCSRGLPRSTPRSSSPLGDLYARILEPIDSFQASTLLQPLEDALSQAKEAFDAPLPSNSRRPWTSFTRRCPRR